MLRRSAALLVLALSSFGCSEDAAPPAQGSLYIELAPATGAPAGAQCPSVGHSANIGNPPPTSTSPGQRVEIGGCRVSGDGSFNGKISQGTVSFTMQGQATQGGVGKGSIVYYDNTIAVTMASENGCDISVNKGNLQVTGGRIWAEFSCPQIVALPTAYCKASGVFVMENCSE
jgi:hypothetical protein